MLIKFIDNFFELKENNSSIKQELYAGLVTFLAMSYIVFVNPDILAEAGMDKNAVFTATILASVFATFLMGIFANSPFALAPGMGLNTFFTYSIVLGMGYTWQIALGAVFISGVLMVLFTILPLRKKIIEALPHNLKISITVGIGLFLLIIGLKNAGIIIPNQITISSLGNLATPSTLLAIFGFALIMFLDLLKIPASILISLIITSILSLALGLSHFTGIIAKPAPISNIALHLDLIGALHIGIITIILSLFLVDFFDSTAVFIALNKNKDKEKLDKKNSKALLVDGIGTIAGSLFGVSTVTSYIESAAGINVGGRTGLTAITVAFLMSLLLFFSPILTMISTTAIAPVLIFISYMMFKQIKDLNWNDNPEEILPSFLIIIMTPLTFSIFTGIGIGVITFLFSKIVTKKWQKEYYFLSLIAIAFIISLIIK